MSGNDKRAWERLLSRIKERVSEDNYALWFANITPIKINYKDKQIVLGVPNPFMKDWLENYYLFLILEELRSVFGPDWTVKFEVFKPSSQLAARSTNASAPISKPRTKRKKFAKPDLNPRFTFDNFVVGDCNAVAHAACLQVAKKPGKSYNPLFLYAGTGLGKTHLMQAIAHEIVSTNPDYNVLYISAETFVNELVASIREGTKDAFHAKFRTGCDVLLIDDIHFIAGKASTQEEFFHTFNHLYNMGKQIVITADQYPAEIKNLDERLSSRFQSGLVVDIKPPDIETRVAILMKKAQQDELRLPQNVALFIAEWLQADANVRELEGALTRVVAYATLTGRPITVELAKQALKDYKPRKQYKDPNDIIKIVSNYYRVSTTALKGKSRMSKISYPRQVAMYLLKRYTSLSLQEIGNLFGRRDHTTVMYAINKIERLIIEDPRVQYEIEALAKSIERL